MKQQTRTRDDWFTRHITFAYAAPSPDGTVQQHNIGSSNNNNIDSMTGLSTGLSTTRQHRTYEVMYVHTVLADDGGANLLSQLPPLPFRNLHLCTTITLS